MPQGRTKGFQTVRYGQKAQCNGLGGPDQKCINVQEVILDLWSEKSPTINWVRIEFCSST